jgi:hypothetical protein
MGCVSNLKLLGVGAPIGLEARTIRRFSELLMLRISIYFLLEFPGSAEMFCRLHEPQVLTSSVSSNPVQSDTSDRLDSPFSGLFNLADGPETMASVCAVDYAHDP